MLGLPLGLGVHFLIDSIPYVIPMATEEPSIVAAVSSGAKILSRYGGGIHTEGHEGQSWRYDKVHQPPRRRQG